MKQAGDDASSGATPSPDRLIWPVPHATVVRRRRRRPNRKRRADLEANAIAAGISKLCHFVARSRERVTGSASVSTAAFVR